jgi:hypothetical protein
MNRRIGCTAIAIGTATAVIPTIILFAAVTYLFVIPLAIGLFCVFLGITVLLVDGEYAKHVGWIVAILASIGWVAPFGIIAYYEQPGHPIALVVPDGYRGEVKLSVDREQGIKIPLTDGRYVYNISDNGELIIMDAGPFRRWHETTCTYRNGNPIAIAVGDGTSSDAVQLHSLGSGKRFDGVKTEEYVEFFVGTNAELRKHYEHTP